MPLRPESLTARKHDCTSFRSRLLLYGLAWLRLFVVPRSVSWNDTFNFLLIDTFVLFLRHLVDQYWALTAAHCVAEMTPANLKLLVGEHDISTAAETKYTATYTINKFVVHENYNKATGENDIALIRVPRMQFSKNVNMVCLPLKTRADNYDGVTVTTAGWGTLEFGGSVPSRLQKVNLQTITNAVCKNSYSTLTSGFICTYTENKDTCQMDSGNALYYTDTNSRLYAVGVVSGGSGCAGSKPSLNTRVKVYTDWIVKWATLGTFCNI